MFRFSNGCVSLLSEVICSFIVKVPWDQVGWAVDSRVLIYIHKEAQLDAVANRYPAGAS